MAIPRHAFILWVAIRDGLTAGDRLLKWDANGDVLFFFLVVVCQYPYGLGGYFRERHWSMAGQKVEGSVVYKLAWARLDSVHIWRHHNDVKLGNLLHSEEQVFHKI
jgi:hypothetical protein